MNRYRGESPGKIVFCVIVVCLTGFVIYGFERREQSIAAQEREVVRLEKSKVAQSNQVDSLKDKRIQLLEEQLRSYGYLVAASIFIYREQFEVVQFSSKENILLIHHAPDDTRSITFGAKHSDLAVARTLKKGDHIVVWTSEPNSYQDEGLRWSDFIRIARVK